MNTSPKLLRTKSIKINLSEEQTIELILPLVQFTAYMLSINKVTEIPSIQTLIASLSKSKIILARLLGNHFTRIVNYEHLTGINIEVITSGGYFKLQVREVIPENNTTQNFNITISNGTTLNDKLYSVVKTANPNLSKEQIMDETLKLLLKI